MKNKEKYKWVEDLDADELKTALYDTLEENDSLKRFFLSGNTKSSVVLKSNSKGVNVDVKAYNDDVSQASRDAKHIFDKLRMGYNDKED